MKAKKTLLQKIILSLLLVASLFAGFWQMREVSWAASTYVVCPTLTIGCTHTTIAGALSDARSGDTVEIRAGTYVAEGLSTDTKDLTIRGVGAAVIEGKNTAPILTISRGTVSVSGLTFIASGKGKANGVNVSLATATISNCTFTNLTGTAIAANPGTVTLSGNNISGSSYGVTANNMSSLTMNNNTISGSANAGVVLSSSSTLNSSAGNDINTNGTNGIELSSSAATLGNNNLIYSNADNGILVSASALNITGTGTQIYDNSNNGISTSGSTFTVKYSQIFENGAAGINATAASTCTSIDQNAIYANTTGIQLDAVTACTIDNNTIDGNANGISASHASTATVTDNAVTYNTTYGLYNSGDSTITTNYNDYFANGTNFSNQAAGANDVFVNPFYTDRDNYDFVLQAESLLVDLGQSGVDLGYQPSAVISGRDPATGVIVDNEIVGTTPGTTADTTDISDGMAALLRAKSARSWESGLLQVGSGTYNDQDINISGGNITLDGSAAAEVSITGNNTANIINVSDTGNVIRDITFADTGSTIRNAISLASGSAVTISDSIFTDIYGSAVSATEAAVTLTGNTIAGSASDAISLTDSSCPSITENLIYGNAANGITLDGVTSCTIDNNTLDGNDNGIGAINGSVATVTDNAITYNGNYGLENSDSTITTNYNDYFGNGGNLSGQTAGTNDIFVNPFYTDHDNADFTLQNASLLVDLGQSGVNLGYQPDAVLTPRAIGTGVIVDDLLDGNTPGTTADSDSPADALAALVRAKTALSWASGTLFFNPGNFTNVKLSVNTSNITLQGSGATETTLNKGTGGAILTVTASGVKIDGFKLQNDSQANQDVLHFENYAGCTVSNNVFDGTTTVWSSLHFFGASNNLLVEDNVFAHCGNTCMDGSLSSNATVRRNLFYEGSNKAISLEVGATGTIDNNTIHSFPGYGIWITGTPISPVTITDNSFSSNSKAIYSTDADANNSYNNFWNNTNDYYNGVTAGSGETYINPFYTDSANDDYSLLDGSLLIDLGTSGVDIGYQPSAVKAARAEGTGVYAGTSIVGNTPGSTADTTSLANAVAATTRAQAALGWTTGTLHLLAGTYNTQLIGLGSNISIIGASAANTIINGDTSSEIIYTGDETQNISISNLGFTDTGAGQVSAITIGADTSGMVVSNCRFTNISGSAITNYGSEGTFTNNIISGSGLSGIKFEAGAACTSIQGNLIYDSIEAGLDLSSSGACTVTYNTIDNNANGVYANGATDLTLTDNLITNNNTAITFETTTATLTNNDYWGNTTNFSGVEAGTSDLFLNPFYTNLASDDYRLLDDSLMIGMASNNSANIGYTYDAGGTVRSTNQVIVDDSIDGNTPLTTADTLSIQAAENAAGRAYGALGWESATINVGEGTYDESVTIDTSGLDFEGLDSPILTSANDNQTLLFDGSTAGTWAGFVVENTGEGHVIALSNGANQNIAYNEIYKSGYDHSSGDGIHIETGGNIGDSQIYGNLIHDATANGINIISGSSGYLLIENNRIYNNGADGIRFDSNEPHIRLNQIFKNLGNGVEVLGSAESARIINNTIDKNVGYGLLTDSNPLIQNNQITLNQAGGLYCPSKVLNKPEYNNLWSNGYKDNYNCSLGDGNISDNPLYYGTFVYPDSDQNDYYLCADSSSLDAGASGANIGFYDGAGESACPFRAEDSYVSPTGNNLTGDGSESNPWATLGFAAEYTQSGTVYLSSGDFTAETYPIYLPRGISAIGESSISSSIRMDANYAYGEDTRSYDALLAYGTQDIEGLRFLWAPNAEDSYGIKIIGDAVNFRNNIFDGYRYSEVPGSNALGIKNAIHVNIFNNLFYNFQNDIITCLGDIAGCGAEITNNTFYDAIDSAVHLYGSASSLTATNNIFSTVTYGINNENLASVSSDYNDFYDIGTVSYVSVTPGEHDLNLDPVFYDTYIEGIRYLFLSHTDAGQASTSPLFNVGSTDAVTLNLNGGTTRLDYYPDLSMVDLGFHVPGNVTPVATIGGLSAWYNGTIDLNYTVSDENTDLINFLEEGGYTIEYSIDGAEWYDASDAGGESEGYENLVSSTYPGSSHLFVWDAPTDLGTLEDNGVLLRILPNDGTLGALDWTVSGEFGFDNVSPVVTAPSLTASPVSSDGSLGVNIGEISEQYPEQTVISYKINDGDYIEALTLEDDLTSFDPLDLELAEGYTLKGDDVVQLKVSHTDKATNLSSAESESYYVQPLAPLAPSLSNPTNSTLQLEPLANPSEQGDVMYAFYVTSVTPQTTLTPADTSWPDHYVSADGSPVTEAVWQSAANWGSSITLEGLTYYSEYCIVGISSNPRSSNLVVSDESTASCLATTASGPNVEIISASQSTEGNQLSNINIDIADQIGANNSAKLEYASSESGPFTKAQILGDYADAEYLDVMGAPKINNLNDYQVGTLKGRKIVTAYESSLVENQVEFTWESGVDLPEADGTYYVKVSVKNEEELEGTAVRAITLDNVKPAVTSEVHFSALPLTSGDNFSLVAAFSDTNPGSNAFAYNLNNPDNINLLPLTEFTNGDSNTGTPSPKEYLITLDGDDCFYALRARHIDDFGNLTYSENATQTCVRPMKPSAPTLSNGTLESIDIVVNENAEEAAKDTVLYAIKVSAETDTSWQGGKYLTANGEPSATPVWQTRTAWATVTIQDIDPEATYTVQTIAANPQSDNETLSEWSDEATLTPSVSLISNGTGGGDWSKKESWKVDEVTPATSAPRSIDRVTILSGDTISLDPSTATVRQITINAGGSLVFENSLNQKLAVLGNITVDGSLALNAGNTLEITSDSSSSEGMRGLVINSSGKLELQGSADNLARITASTQDGNHNTYLYAKAGAEIVLNYADLSYLGANFSNRYGLYLEGVDSSLVGSGLTMTNSKLHHNYHGIYLSANSNSNTLSNNEFYSNQGFGVYLVDSSANNLTQNIIHNNASNGVYLLNADSNTLSNNSAYGNQGNGIYLASAEENTLNSNTIYENTQNGLYFLDSDQNLLGRNSVHDNTANGISLNLSNENSLSRDSVYNNKQAGILLSDSSNNTITNTNLYRNTAQGVKVYNDSQSDQLVNLTAYDNGTYGVELSGNTKYPSKTLLKNSIVAMNDSTEVVISGASDTQLDYNNVYDANNQEYSGISADVNSISADPLFLNNTSPDLRLYGVSPSRDTGNPQSSYSNEPEPNGDRINQGSYGNTEEATKSEPATVISSISQATDGTGYVTMRFSLTRASNLSHQLKIEYSPDNGVSYYDPQLLSSSSGTLNNSSEYQISGLSPGTENITVVWDTKNSLNSGGSLDSFYLNTMKLRFTTFAEVTGTPVTSSAFALDNKAPLVTSNVAFSGTPSSGSQSITLTASFNEENPSLTQFAYALNGSTYSSYLTASGISTPSNIQLPITLSTALQGDDYFLKLKARHVDKFGNETITENLTATYITPLSPNRPAFSDITKTSAKLELAANSNEQGDVLYAINVSETTPSDSNWQEKYLDQKGQPSSSPVYLSLSAWQTPQFNNLKSTTSYLVRVRAANPYQTSVTSEWSTANSFTTLAENVNNITGSVSGFCYVDENQNARLDSGEQVLDDLGIRLYVDSNGNGQLDSTADTLVDSQSSSEAGYFIFAELAADTYFLTVNAATVPDDYQASTASTLKIVLTAGENSSEQNFGYYQQTVTPPVNLESSASGRVFWDKNVNGRLDESDSYLDNIEVLLKQHGSTLATASSNSLGNFSFDHLAAGDYSLKLSVPSQYTATTSDTVNFNLQAGQDYNAAIFGLTLITATPPVNLNNASISGKVFLDSNRNDSFDSGESGVAAVQVSLSSATQANASVQSTTTDAAGTYTFTTLADGDYLVSVSSSSLAENLNLVVYSQNITIRQQQAISNLDFPCYRSAQTTEPEEPSVEDELKINPEDDEQTKSDKETKIEEEIKDQLAVSELPQNKAVFSSYQRSITLPLDQENLNVSSNAPVQMLIAAGQGILKIESVLEYNGIKMETYYPQDFNKDGVYTLDFNAPPELGDHILRTFITYADNRVVEITNKVIVDPEGYIYETLTDGQEKRISDALVTIYVYSNLSSKFEVWPAVNFNQVNPQITKKQGSYQFLVPNGKYYIDVQAPGYYRKQTNVFEVKVTRPVNINIELEPKFRFNATVLKFLIGILALGLFTWLVLHTKQSYDQRRQNAIKKTIQRDRELAQKESKKTANEKRKIER